MTRAEKINTFVHGFVAVGTIVIAILAIWGDPIRARFVGPELELSLRLIVGFSDCFAQIIRPK